MTTKPGTERATTPPPPPPTQTPPTQVTTEELTTEELDQVAGGNYGTVNEDGSITWYDDNGKPLP